MEPLPNKTLGQRLRELRQRDDLSLRELGDKLKDLKTATPVSAAFLSDIENGRRFPSDDMIEKFADLFGVDTHELKSCDPRGPIREIQDLATMNPQYAFAFRRAVEYVQESKISPETLLHRIHGVGVTIVEDGLRFIPDNSSLPDSASGQADPTNDSSDLPLGETANEHLPLNPNKRCLEDHELQDKNISQE